MDPDPDRLKRQRYRLCRAGRAVKVEKSAVLLYKIISGGMMEKEFTPVSIPTSLYKK